MNLIDLFILIIIAITILEGVYKGFINSVCRIGAFFLSWIFAFIFSPGVAKLIQNNQKIFNTLLTYVEGSQKLGNVDNAKIIVDQLNQTDMNSIINNANFPQPFANLIKENINNHAFASKGVTTLGDYVNQTIACTIINILSFLIIFLIVSILFTFIINSLDHTMHFPMLRQFDGLLGAGFGLILGCFMVYVIFLVVPMILIAVDMKIITEYMKGSFLGSFFYNSNFILNFMRGVI